jgi:hypothetical protein
MRKFILIVLGAVIICSLSYADEFNVTYTPEQKKAVEYYVLDAQVWLNKAWQGKVSNCIDRLIVEISDYNPSKLTPKQKETIIKEADIVSRAEREAE